MYTLQPTCNSQLINRFVLKQVLGKREKIITMGEHNMKYRHFPIVTHYIYIYITQPCYCIIEMTLRILIGFVFFKCCSLLTPD